MGEINNLYSLPLTIVLTDMMLNLKDPPGKNRPH